MDIPTREEVTEGLFSIPGFEFPYRGRPYGFKDGDREKRPALTLEPKVRIFSIEEGSEGATEFEHVLALCANGRADFLFQHIAYDTEKGAFKVLVGWVEGYYEEPGEAETRRLNL